MSLFSIHKDYFSFFTYFWRPPSQFHCLKKCSNIPKSWNDCTANTPITTSSVQSYASRHLLYLFFHIIFCLITCPYFLTNLKVRCSYQYTLLLNPLACIELTIVQCLFFFFKVYIQWNAQTRIVPFHEFWQMHTAVWCKPLSRYRKSPSPQTSHKPFPNKFSPPLASTVLIFSITDDYCFSGITYKWDHIEGPLALRVLPFCMRYLRFIHVAACISFYWWVAFQCMKILLCLSIPLVHKSAFAFGALMNKAAMNIRVCLFCRPKSPFSWVNT